MRWRRLQPGDDKAEIEAKMQTLTDISGKLAERAHQKSQGGDGPAAGDGGDGGDGGEGTAGTDDVVDAEFEEVRDDRH